MTSIRIVFKCLLKNLILLIVVICPTSTSFASYLILERDVERVLSELKPRYSSENNILTFTMVKEDAKWRVVLKYYESDKGRYKVIEEHFQIVNNSLHAIRTEVVETDSICGIGAQEGVPGLSIDDMSSILNICKHELEKRKENNQWLLSRSFYQIDAICYPVRLWTGRLGGLIFELKKEGDKWNVEDVSRYLARKHIDTHLTRRCS